MLHSFSKLDVIYQDAVYSLIFFEEFASILSILLSTRSAFIINPLCPRVAQKQHKSIVHFGREILKMYLKFLVCIASHSVKIIKKVPFLIFTSNYCPISILFGYVHQFFSMLPHSNKKEPVEALCLYFVL